MLAEYNVSSSIREWVWAESDTGFIKVRECVCVCVECNFINKIAHMESPIIFEQPIIMYLIYLWLHFMFCRINYFQNWCGGQLGNIIIS